ncbi:MAG: tetratricopeptide repeat protein, partial [Bacteroidales bacterium]|nr:tetratricopeptide repeat protein [Bacteroidales bacterium]
MNLINIKNRHFGINYRIYSLCLFFILSNYYTIGYANNSILDSCLTTFINTSFENRSVEDFKSNISSITKLLKDVEIKNYESYIYSSNHTYSNIDSFYIELCHCVSLYERKKYSLAYTEIPELRKGVTSDIVLAFFYEYKGNIERYTDRYTDASNSFLNSIKFYNILNNNHELTRLYYKIGVLNLDIKNYVLAEEYLEKAMKHANLSSNKKLQKTTTSTLASLYHSQRNYFEALKLYRIVLKDFSVNKKDSARILMNIGSVYRARKMYREAEKSYLLSLRLRKELGDNKAIANINNNIGKLHLSNNEFEKANLFLKRSYNYADTTNSMKLALSSSYNLVELNMHRQEIDSALKYFHIYVDLRKKLGLSDIKKQLIDLDKKYKTLEKDNQIANLQKEDALNQARLKTKNILIVITIGFMVVLLIVGYLINRQRKELVQSRRRLLRQKEDITGMNEQLRVSNLSKDRILSVIGHDLRGPVGGLKELIELYMELPEYEPNDIKNLLKAAREASTSTYHLLENLLSWANSQRGELVYNPVSAPVLPLVKQTVQLLDTSINTRHIQFKFDIPESMVVQVDLNMLRTIIRN